MLKNKNAVIYGAGGSLGGAVAAALAKAGAKVFLSGHNVQSVQKAADSIKAEGGAAEVFEVDALNEIMVNNFVDEVARRAGTVDISFSAIDTAPVQNISLVEMSISDYMHPVDRGLRSNFLTATAAARVMIKQRSGVILSLTATPGGIGYPYTGGFAAACTALESLSRNLASELGQYGVRAVNIRSGGCPDSLIFKSAVESNPSEMEQVLKEMSADTMLKALPLMKDVANAAVFLCSGMASTITGITLDLTAGTTVALNYKARR